MSNAVEIIRRDRGVPAAPACTVQLVFALSVSGVAFKDDVKREVPPGAWHYDPEDHRWFVMPKFFDLVVVIAMRHFDHVYEAEGTRRVDLVTGSEQKGLF